MPTPVTVGYQIGDPQSQTLEGPMFYSPRPRCPDPHCTKIWAPTKADARIIRRELSQEKGDKSQVRYYQHAGGWHFTSDIEGRTKPLRNRL